ncbi:hypothetical protein AC792_01925 [Arthrobacter sp. RIT-PI-e]|uniref:hypothetical protein n=1 Tax=Arthrobacter sp. RIT-PI-e TaxID=1681197 RepID=UPI0006763AAE|nr:hypothetical protein [Arthrobacter sp. RIT-PI-e]KNC20244.1 hypothetical protein AC792_01925 [Arthrobacter sp. RIT-PI-e]
MMDSSSAGNPGGAALPADHPLGPASPVPPEEKEPEFVGRAPVGADGTTSDGSSHPDDATGSTAGGPSSGSADDGAPAPDRREDVLDPSAGSAGHRAATIRDEQHTHDAGTVPAAFNGTSTPEDPERNRRPEDAAAEPDSWDSGGATH